MIDAMRPQKKAMFGIPGLDDVTSGGLAEGHLFLLEGSPGTGKTTIALQFLLEGEKLGETELYITLSETENELRFGATSHDWTIGPLTKVFDLCRLKPYSAPIRPRPCCIRPILNWAKRRRPFSIK